MLKSIHKYKGACRRVSANDLFVRETGWVQAVIKDSVM